LREPEEYDRAMPFRRRVRFDRLGVRGPSTLLSGLVLLACQVDSSSDARDGSAADAGGGGNSPDAKPGGEQGAGGAPGSGGGAPSGGRAGGEPGGGRGGGEPSRGGANASGGAATGGAGGVQTGALFFDDFLGSSIDGAKWAVFDRISDQANGEINCCAPANVSVSGGFLNGLSKHEDRTCGDSQMSPIPLHYTSWQIQQKTPPFLYGTVEVRARPPGGTGIWPDIWMLGFEWQRPRRAHVRRHQRGRRRYRWRHTRSLDVPADLRSGLGARHAIGSA
jgi:hypothetical protein